MRSFAKAIGTTAETLYSWFRGEAEPNLGYIREMAKVLGVRRSEIVAALDGEVPPVPMGEELADAIAREVARQLGRDPDERPPR